MFSNSFHFRFFHIIYIGNDISEQMDETAFIVHYGPNHSSFYNILQTDSFVRLERMFLAARKHQEHVELCDEYIEMMIRYAHKWWLKDIHKQLSAIHDDLQVHNSSRLKKHFEKLYFLLQKLSPQKK